MKYTGIKILTVFVSPRTDHPWEWSPCHIRGARA